MSVEHLAERLASHGVELWFEGSRLRFRAPEGALTAELRAEVGAHRNELLTALRNRAAARRERHALSFSQRSLWFLHQQDPQSPAYHVAMSMRIVSAIDTDALGDAVQALVDRHAVLRTTYDFGDDGPVQCVAGSMRVMFTTIDCAEGDEDALRARIEADYRRPFDLGAGPVLRVSLYSRAPASHVLLLTVHHAAADGWSLFLLFQELLCLYEERAGGAPANLPKPSAEYTDYVAWQDEMLRGPEGERLWSYWREKLSGPRAPLVLPTDHPDPGTRSGRGASHPFELPPQLVEGVKELARREGGTLFTVLLACFHALLHRLSEQTDIVVGAPTFGRNKAEFASVVGDFVNPVPFRARCDSSMSARTLIAHLRETVHGALDAQEFPLPLLVERLQPERDAGRTPLFDAFFILQRFDQFRDVEELLVGVESDRVIERGSLRLASYPLNQQEGQFDLALQMAERSGSLHAVFKYNPDLFERTTIARWAESYAAIVDAIVSAPDTALRDLPAPHVPVRGNEEAVSLLEALTARDIAVAVDGDRLRVNAPKGALDDALKVEIARHKSALIAALLARRDAPASRVSIPRVSRVGPLPVSSAQQRLWFFDQLDPGRPDYNIGCGLRIRGALDTRSLRRAVDGLIARQESLRTRIIASDDGPAAFIADPPTVGLDEADVSSHTDAEARARELLGKNLREGFDLSEGPLARFLLIRLADDHHILAIAMHHAIADGWSLTIAIDETFRIYEAVGRGEEGELTPLTIQYVDYSAWEREQLHTGRMDSHFAYWRQQLAGAPLVLDLPSDRPRPATPTFRGARLRRDFAADVFDSIAKRSRSESTTPFMLLLAAWQVLLGRYSGQQDILVGTPVANRSQPGLERLIGCLVNNVVIRGRLDGAPTFAELLARTKDTTVDAFVHSDLPFDVLVEGLNPQRTTSHSPLFQVLFTFMSFSTDVAMPDGLTGEFLDADTGAARFDLTVEIAEHDGRLTVLYEYSTDLFDGATIARLHRHYETLLHAAATDPSRPIRDLPLLTSDEHAEMDSWNDTYIDHDRSRLLHQLLEASARATPDAIAVSDATTTLTFAELDRRANQLAQALRARGVDRGARVGVCLDRTVDMPVALAAILKCGAAYVPLDPTHPADRLRYILDDSAVTCVLTLDRFRTQLSDGSAPLVTLDALTEGLASFPDTPPATTCTPDDVAYVIYTSGSTGRPKGVQVEHRNVVSFLEAMRREPGVTASDVLLAVTTLSFDIAGLELWLPLSVGARVVIASRADVLDGQRLIHMMDAHGVTVLQATPATWRLLIDSGWQGRPELIALCGGEALPRDLASQLLERVGALWNMYGPTETTIWSTVHRVLDTREAIPIGHPIANTRVYVLEPSGMRAPIGVPGELCIGGEGVARGYLDRTELTADRFVSIVLADGTPERVYRTGDQARLRADGTLEYLGRRDTQVKVRGYRIELGEIETVLASQPGVKECAVVVREDVPGDQRLTGYVIPVRHTPFDPEAARASLRLMLPEYMIPNAFVTLDALPLTPNGKVDRKALPAPHAAAATIEDAAAQPVLMTPPQRRVAAVWRDVLRVDRIGLYDNFFDVGGHSLLLVKLQAGLRREFGSDIPLVEMFQRTTVSAQAERLSSALPASAALTRAAARAARQGQA
ncbi:MAG: amino acid adenylation domain-containing protein [Gemmatimonadales bacterium]